MKAISVRQPWANLIAAGEKTIEVRRWATRHRGPLLIVSSLRPAVEPAGTALAIVDLVECRPMTRADEPAAMSVREAGAVAWVLENVRAVEPVAVTGRPGLYNVEM